MVLTVGAVILWAASVVASAGGAISVDPSFSTVYVKGSEKLIVLATKEAVMEVGGEDNPISAANHLCAKIWKDNPQLKKLMFVISMTQTRFQEVHCK